MINYKQGFLLKAVLFLALAGCGSSTGNVNPVDLFDASNSSPALDTIIPQNTAFTSLVSGFSSANPYWIFSAGSFYGGSYLAPATGYVSSTGTCALGTSTVTCMTIIHSGLLATRVYGIQTILVRPGDSVVGGQIIGTYVNSGQVGFQVLYNNTAVCPLSYVSTAFRTLLSQQAFFSTLCL